MTEELQELENMLHDLEATFQQHNNEKKDLFHHFKQIMERIEKEKYTGHSRSIRHQEKNKKKITSIAIHEKNQQRIHKLQKEARDEGFFLSKENIVNMGLEVLDNELIMKGISIHDLFMDYL